MVRGRLIPTSYFHDPDVMSLSSPDGRLILVGLVLGADDWGRGLAHSVIVGRDLDYPPEVIEATLAELEQADLVRCYQSGKHRYYVLTRWDEWQKLPEAKRTSSRIPAPPAFEGVGASSQDFPDFSGENLEIPENSGENPPESESNLNPSRIRIEDEEAQPSPDNILPFPSARVADAADPVFSQQAIEEAAKQVAGILKLPLTDDLARVVADYLGRPGLSLLGEADAAMEWIGDPERNRRKQRMTPAFFRRWLKRETESIRSAGTAPDAPRASSTAAQIAPARLAVNGTGPPGAASEASAAGNPYHTFVQQRAAQLTTQRAPSNTEDAKHETHS